MAYRATNILLIALVGVVVLSMFEWQSCNVDVPVRSLAEPVVESVFPILNRFVLHQHRDQIELFNNDLTGTELWWSIDGLHPTRTIKLLTNGSVNDQTGWYLNNKTLLSWNVTPHDDTLHILQKNGNEIRFRRVSSGEIGAKILLIQELNMNFVLGYGKNTPEIGSSEYPLCRAGWVHGESQLCYRVSKSPREDCVTRFGPNTDSVIDKRDVSIVRNLLMRQRAYFAIATGNKAKILIQSTVLQSHTATDLVPGYVCYLKRQGDCSSGWTVGTDHCYSVVKTVDPNRCSLFHNDSSSDFKSNSPPYYPAIQNLMRKLLLSEVFFFLDGKKFRLLQDSNPTVYNAQGASLPLFVCSRPKYVASSLPKVSHYLYTGNIPVPAHQLIPSAYLVTRDGLGDLAELDDYRRGVELCPQAGAFTEKLLRSWKSVERFYAIDTWEGNDEEFNFITKRMSQFGSKVSVRRKPPLESSEMFQNDSLDFIYLSSPTDFITTQSLLKQYWSKCRSGGIISGYNFLSAAEVTKTGLNWMVQPDGTTHIGGPRVAVELFAESVGRDVFITKEMPTWNGVAFRSWIIKC